MVDSNSFHIGIDRYRHSNGWLN